MLERQKLLRARLRQEGLEPKDHGPVRLADLVELDAAAYDVLRKQGLAYLSGGKIDECRSIFEMLHALGDFSPPGFFILARCWELLGDPRKAKGYFRIGWELVDGDREDGVALKNAALRWGSHLAPYSNEGGETG
jgi:hypothetical protein